MRLCFKRGARALFDFRLRFQISDFDFQSAILALFWGLALFDLWYLSKQSGNTVAILYGVTLAVIANQAIHQARVDASVYRIYRAFAEYLAVYRGIDRTAANADAHPPIVDSRRGRSELLSANDARTQNIRPRINRIKNCDCHSKCAIAIF